MEEVQLIDQPIAKRWLSQFSEVDRPVAIDLLQSLRLISFREVEESLQRLIDDFAKSHKGKIALFPVVKPERKETDTLIGRIISFFQSWYGKPQIRRRRYGSEGRVGHMLVNMERRWPNQFVVEPTEVQMRAEKIKHIILVDDICGSGDRVLNFWKSFRSKSVRSWLSSKHCTLNAIVYAAEGRAIRRLRKRLKQINEIHVILKLGNSSVYHEEAFESLGAVYGPPDSRGLKSFSAYGGTASNIIFQHGCPNNAPQMLWRRGGGWEPLFLRRSIPLELYPCFECGGEWHIRHKRLVRARQARLAAALASDIEQGRVSEKMADIIFVLGLLLRKVSVANLAAHSMLSQHRIDKILTSAKLLGFVDSSGAVSKFGRDIVERVRTPKRSKEKVVIGVEEAIKFYYP